MGVELNPPALDEIEISIFGPGYGESIAIHVCCGDWILIDSCIDQESKLPAPIAYFRKLGIDPEKAVRQVIATHWHDDHVRGIADLLDKCKTAEFVLSGALRTEEFFKVVMLGQKAYKSVSGPGTDEMSRVFEILKGRNKKKLASADKVLWKRTATAGSGEVPVEVWSLSPSDDSITRALAAIAFILPTELAPIRRVADLSPNHAAVVVWVKVGDQRILLGSDLEETNEGWTTILSSTTRPDGAASVFKIPHHGSKTAHHADVWTKMLHTVSFAALTPFVRGSVRLPTQGDVTRITALSQNAFATASPVSRRKRRDPAVEKTIREIVKSIHTVPLSTGQVRFRRITSTESSVWEVSLINGASKLSECLTG